MKRLIVILSMVFISTALFATIDGDFVRTNEGTFFFKKVKMNFVSNFIGVKSTGEKVKFKRADVIAYSIGGEQFEKMPIYENNQDSGSNDFMKLVSYRNGMRLYEYEYKNMATRKQSRRYYVFRGENYVVEMDYKNNETLSAFFGGNK